jgi:hypothetical protein
MTRVAILPVPTERGIVSYRAVAGAKHSQGSTVGEALDALTPQLSIDEAGTLIIVLAVPVISAKQHTGAASTL